MGKSIIQEKRFQFALRIIDVYRKPHMEKEYVLSKQLLRSGTSVGPNVEEALAAQSGKDFLSKMSIASKEARETRYWLGVLQTSKLVSVNLNTSLVEIEEIVRILTSIAKTTVQPDSET